MLKIIIFLILILFIINCRKQENFNNNKVYKINNVVDKVYIINLDKEKERFKLVSNNLKKNNIKFTRISAIYGKNVYNSYNNLEITKGALGCLLSHKKILEDAIKNNYKKILVLEDDVILDKKFNSKFNEKYSYFIKKNPQYDLLYLGCSQTTHTKKMWDTMYIDKHFYIPQLSNGTFAMLINNTIFKDLLKCISKYDEPYDKMIVNNILDNKKCFSIYPHLITAKVDLVSETDNKVRSQDKYLENNRLKKSDFY